MPSNTTQRLPHSVWEPIRQYILARDNYICQVCECRLTVHDRRLLTHAQVDHIVALSAGGTDQESNLRAICLRDNSRKGQIERSNKQRAQSNGNNWNSNSGVGLRTSRAW